MIIVCIMTEAALVRSPLNTALVQGSAVTLECGSNVSNAFILWFSNGLCQSYDAKTCETRVFIYNGYSYIIDPLKFNITKVDINATHVTRDLIIKSAEFTDAGVYVCEEHITGVAGVQDSRSAQVAVLGSR